MSLSLSETTPTDGVFSPLGQGFTAGLAAGDLDGDGLDEIVACAWDTRQVFAFNVNGSVLAGWPRALVNSTYGIWATPTLADLDLARVDGTTLIHGAAASPWVQFEQQLPRNVRLRAGTGQYQQEPSSEQVAGLHGGGDGLSRQRALHVDLGFEQTIGARTRWQVSLFDREEQDVAFASGLEPRTTGSLVPYNPAARYANRLDGYARGIEGVVQRRDPNGLSGWVAYAYERSRYADSATGESFDGDYDQRHTLTAYGSLRLWSRATAVAKYRAGSNIPVRGYYLTLYLIGKKSFHQGGVK